MPAWIEQWFTNIRELANLEVERIPLASSKNWSIVNGSLVHTTGRFFQVSAVHWIDPNNETFFQPLLVQQEIGILGFAISGWHILLQAQVEPGNVGMVQLAPE